MNAPVHAAAQFGAVVGLDVVALQAVQRADGVGAEAAVVPGQVQPATVGGHRAPALARARVARAGEGERAVRHRAARELARQGGLVAQAHAVAHAAHDVVLAEAQRQCAHVHGQVGRLVADAQAHAIVVLRARRAQRHVQRRGRAAAEAAEGAVGGVGRAGADARGRGAQGHHAVAGAELQLHRRLHVGQAAHAGLALARTADHAHGQHGRAALLHFGQLVECRARARGLRHPARGLHGRCGGPQRRRGRSLCGGRIGGLGRHVARGGLGHVEGGRCGSRGCVACGCSRCRCNGGSGSWQRGACLRG